MPEPVPATERHSEALAELTAAGPVLFYDGDCSLCRRTVNRLVRCDSAGSLRYAPLQGETARALLPPERIARKDTAVLAIEGRLLVRSDAVLAAWGSLRWPWCWPSALRLLPRSWRDAVYDWVAAHRSRLWLGPLESHHAPGLDEQRRFLP